MMALAEFFLILTFYFYFKILIIKKHRKDVSNFDKQFTSEKLDLTPTGKWKHARL